MPTGQVRIIGGKWRGRLLPIADEQGLRPTPDRVRETLFNWIQFEIAGNRCLDLYAGSGVLGFEAASRGAENVVLLDSSKKVSRTLTNNASKFSADNVTILQDDAIRYLRSETEKNSGGLFDIVFVDPPYDSGLLNETCELLEASGFLQNNARIYIEHSSQQDLTDVPACWTPRRSKTTGQVGYHLFDRHGEP